MARPASASVVFFTGQATFDAAVAADSLTSNSFNFNSAASANYANASGLTVDGVNFVGITGNDGYYLPLTPPYFAVMTTTIRTPAYRRRPLPVRSTTLRAA
jgi:hypothetical protein